MKNQFASCCLLLVLVCADAHAKSKIPPPAPLTPEQTALVRRAIAAEKITISAIREHAPLVQTYIQNMGNDVDFNTAPLSDQYMLERVDFSKHFRSQTYRTDRESIATPRSLLGIQRLFGGFRFAADGFLDMMFVDPSGFDEQHYQFSYVRRSFIGSVRTAEFDVSPKAHTGSGRFIGRIWVDDDSGNIVRFNGTYSSSDEDGASRSYFHLDSWRQNLQEGLWLPVGVYVEETTNRHDPGRMDFKAQTQIWGYSLKMPTHAAESETIRIDDVVDQSGAAEDLNPVQARRAWIARAADNVIDRLTEAGLVAKPSDFDSVLETVTNNLIIGNNLEMAGPVHCRVMLTTPLESMAIGNTIILSRGLVDTLPSEAALAAVLAFELAHIVLGHHVDTRYAFDDRLLFTDDAILQRIHMQQTDEDNAAAATRALVLLDGSIYKDKESEAGLYFVQLEARRKTLTALNAPRLGDSLLDAHGTPWMHALVKKAPPLAMKNLDQLGALPLGSRLRINAWDDSVYSLNAKATPLVNVREKMPFEVAPLYFTLTTYARPNTQHAVVVNPSQ
jgi:hypothetical protein